MRLDGSLFLYYILYMQNEKTHVLSKIRAELGINQADAEMIGMSVSTLASLESRRYPKGRNRGRLSKQLAHIVSLHTGVNVEWLLAGDPNKPITTETGEQWTKAYFQNNYAAVRRLRSPEEANMLADDCFRRYLLLVIKLGRVMIAAHCQKRAAFASGVIRHELVRFGKTFPRWEDVENLDHGLQIEMMQGKRAPTDFIQLIFERFNDQLNREQARQRK